MVASTIPAHIAVLDHPDFVSGTHHTKWLEETIEFEGAGPHAAPALPEDEEMSKRDLTVEVGGRRFKVSYWAPEPTSGGTVRRARPKLANTSSSSGGDGVITAPMQGTIVKVSVEAGSSVKAGQAICVLEAMKMENEVTAPNDGAVTDLRVEPGDTVAAGQVIAIVK